MSKNTGINKPTSGTVYDDGGRSAAPNAPKTPPPPPKK